MPYISKKHAREYGYPSTHIQTILIPDKYSIDEARNYLKKNGYLNKNYRTTDNFHRFIQNDVIRGAKYYSKKLNNGIVYVYQTY